MATRPDLLLESPWGHPVRWVAGLGAQVRFHLRAVGLTPVALRRYPKEVVRLLAEVSFGSGALAVIGGTIGVMVAMSLFTGTVVGLQGYAALDQIGTSTLNGFISAYFNTREIAPLVAALALAATVGSGFTAQLGSMRISEEIDALDAMGVATIPYLVTCRMVAGFIAVVPLYVVGLLTSYAGSRLVTVVFKGQSAGTFDHYFDLFLPPVDILLSFVKVVVFAVLVILIHCYYGFKASGGPAGVGIAVGTAVRRSIVTVAVIDFFLSLALWGATTTVRIAG
ncbi:MlaE family ABC transporter permease [Lapillicoccus jejuensis]|uniref:Phospholipid/cholesterol/gamma-HCH transport system permease protein n=1 Tax=Lapillicoccus jejuensis TaxID=402171 RepID=A0A542DWG4_9MICO|nr:ABC transporter permease [Lapillicoccus jejuensis]TQJ07438.1 phospholipid/cholesterol/gamma-HCH transport system permease protein [Lapillicoccus jejuensis]